MYQLHLKILLYLYNPSEKAIFESSQIKGQYEAIKLSIKKQGWFHKNTLNLDHELNRSVHEILLISDKKAVCFTLY